MVLDEKGECNFCKSDRGPADSSEKKRMRKLWDICLYMKRPVAIAFSGGGDSAACLAYLVTEFGLQCVCVMADNGFIPQNVKERAFRLCRQLGTPLTIESFPLAEDLPGNLCDPCRFCMPRIYHVVCSVARRAGAAIIATGHLYSPAFENCKVGTTSLMKIAPLYIDAVKEEERTRLLEKAGWDNSLNFGNSTNCTLLGYTEYLYRKKWGYSPVLAEMSHEIRAGTLDRQNALAKLKRKERFKPEYSSAAEFLSRKGKMMI